jgi:CRP/FNR family transcriptional regulator, cyclic AMP receptor protein
MLDETRKLFEAHGFFGRLSNSDLDVVLSHARTEHYAAGRLIFSKGSQGRSMMAVLGGSIKISTPSPAGREIVLAVIGPGEVFGEIALLDGGERTADARALTECDLLVFDHRDFMPFLERRADLCLLLLRMMCRRLRQTNEHVEGALFEKLDHRLARALLRLAPVEGEKNSAARYVRISQQELANMVGATRERVNKQLHVWQRDGLLELRKREIVVADVVALERLV